MELYDFLAPGYDPLFQRIYAPFRKRALEKLDVEAGSCVLDLACGTGQNFPYLNSALGKKGTVIGVDVSSGMLGKARRVADRMDLARVSLVQMDAARLTPTLLAHEAAVAEVDAVICTYAFTVMENWEEAFRRSFALLRPGGIYLIHDIHAERRGLHVAAFEMATRVDLARESWRLLEERCEEFRFEWIDPSTHIFAGRLFVAWGRKREEVSRDDATTATGKAG